MIQSSMKLAAALALAVVPSLAMAATVKVGVVLTYSGTGAQLAQQIERGMELYLAREGTAKLGEHEIELIKRDDKNPGGDAAKVAVQELIVREDVDLLTGFIYSPNIIASAPLIEQAKVPTLIMNAATAWIGPVALSRRVSMSMWQTGFPMGRYAAESSAVGPPRSAIPTIPPARICWPRSRWASSRRAVRWSTRFPWAGRPRCRTSRRSCSGSRTPARTASTCSCRRATVAAVFKTYAALGMKDAGIV